jgi:hypothetical protein
MFNVEIHFEFNDGNMLNVWFKIDTNENKVQTDREDVQICLKFVAVLVL